MQVESSKYHLRRIAEDIYNITESWKYFIKKGRVAMEQFSRQHLYIFVVERRLNQLIRERGHRTAEKQIRILYDRLSNPIAVIKGILERLRICRDMACQLLSCTRMYMDDEILSKFEITPTLSTAHVLEILEFLSMRYDAEWEVKEMVVLALDNIYDEYEMTLLVEAWDGCPHADGEEFNQKLNAFFKAAGNARLRVGLPE